VARSAAAHAVTFGTLLPGADNLRVLTQGQIIVTGEIAKTLIVAGEKTACTVFHHPAYAKSLRRPAFLQGGVYALLPGHTVAAL
jgi:hypothetical protein